MLGVGLGAVMAAANAAKAAANAVKSNASAKNTGGGSGGSRSSGGGGNGPIGSYAGQGNGGGVLVRGSDGKATEHGYVDSSGNPVVYNVSNGIVSVEGKDSSSGGGFGNIGLSGQTLTDAGVEGVKEQMAKNSKLWHETTDPAARAQLHDANVRLSKSIPGYSYNSASGTWGEEDSASATYQQSSGSGLSLADRLAQREKLSQAWNQTDDPAARQQLHDAAVRLMEGTGYAYNSQTGQWYDNNVPDWLTVPVGDEDGYLPGRNPKDNMGTYSNSDERYLNQLKRIQEEQERAQRLAVEQAVAQVMAQKPLIEQSYDDLAREAYVSNQLAMRDMPQQLAAMGYTGGMTESSLTGLLNTYQNTLSEGERARYNALLGLENDAANIQATGDIAIAQNAAQYAQQLADYYQYLQSLQAQQQQFYDSLAYQQQQDALAQQNYLDAFAYQQQQDALARGDIDRDWQWTLAQYLRAGGDYSGLEAMGIDTTQIRAYDAAVAAQNAAKARSGSGSSRSGSGSKSSSSNNILENLYAIDDEAAAYAYLVSKNLSATEAENLMSYWEQNKTEQASTQQVYEMIQNWWNRKLSVDGFNQTVARAIANGWVTEQQVESWLRAKGLK